MTIIKFQLLLLFFVICDCLWVLDSWFNRASKLSTPLWPLKNCEWYLNLIVFFTFSTELVISSIVKSENNLLQSCSICVHVVIHLLYISTSVSFIFSLSLDTYVTLLSSFLIFNIQRCVCLYFRLCLQCSIVTREG